MLFSIQCWSMWYDSVLWDANLVDYRAVWIFWRLCGFFGIYEVLKWFTPCWTSDFFRYIMKDMILDLLQCATHCFLGLLGILGGWESTTTPVSTHKVLQWLLHNWFHLINAISWYDSVLWDANLVDYRAMWVFENLWGSEMVYPMLDQWFLQVYHEGCDVRPFAVCNPLILGLLGILGGW